MGRILDREGRRAGGQGRLRLCRGRRRLGRSRPHARLCGRHRSASRSWCRSRSSTPTTGSRPPPPSARRPRPRPGRCAASTTSRPSQLLQDALGEKLAGLIDRPERQVLDAQRLAALGHARHQGRRCRRRHPRASDRRHGLDRPGRFARADDPDRRRRQPRREPLYRAGGARRDGEDLADPAHRLRPVRRLHRLLPQSGARQLCAHATRRSAASRWR